MEKIVLYIHGMGGGGDSRIPSILRDVFAPAGVKIVARTYDFDPEVAAKQIAVWVEELKPDLVIGESIQYPCNSRNQCHPGKVTENQ